MNIIETKKAPAAIGPYSQAIEAKDYVFLSGQIALNPETGKVLGTNIESQAEQVFKNIGEILQATNIGFANVVKTTCFIADMADFVVFNQLYERLTIKSQASK